MVQDSRVIRPLFLVAAMCCSTCAGGVELHYAPPENLEQIDVALIESAKLSIDLAAFVLTDWPVIAALDRALDRGVVVRVVLDPSQHHSYARLDRLADGIRIKHKGPLMHLKAYAIDGAVLRTGSANLSASGEKRQDNDLIVDRDAASAMQFERRFEQIWDAAVPLQDVTGTPSMEP